MRNSGELILELKLGSLGLLYPTICTSTISEVKLCGINNVFKDKITFQDAYIFNLG